MKDGSSMPRCKRPECVEQAKTFELSNKHSHGKSTGGEGFKEIKEVQVTERRTSKGNTCLIRMLSWMPSCAQLEKHEAQTTEEQKWKKIIELLQNTIYHTSVEKWLWKMCNKQQTWCELQKKPRQQDDFQNEIQVIKERRQTADNQLKQHQKSKEDVLRGLPKTTTIDGFQGLIRDEKDKQHVYKQDRDWSAADQCKMEIKSLASRQTRLGELEQQETEKHMELEEQIRSINHRINVTEVNDVQSAEEQGKLQEEKRELIQTQDAWRAFVDTWNSLEEPKKINLEKKNKMEFAKEPDNNSKEPEKINLEKKSKMEFAKETDTNSEESEEISPVERIKMEAARISDNKTLMEIKMEAARI